MSTKEKIKQQLDELTEPELRQISILINEFKGKSGKNIQRISNSSLKLRDFGGTLDHTNVRDSAYD